MNEQKTFRVKAGKVTRHFQQLDIEDALRRNPAFKEIPETMIAEKPEQSPAARYTDIRPAHWQSQLRDNGRFSSKERQKRKDVANEKKRDWRDEVGELIFVCGCFVLFLWIVAGGIGGTAAVVFAMQAWRGLGQ